MDAAPKIVAEELVLPRAHPVPGLRASSAPLNFVPAPPLSRLQGHGDPYASPWGLTHGLTLENLSEPAAQKGATSNSSWVKAASSMGGSNESSRKAWAIDLARGIIRKQLIGEATSVAPPRPSVAPPRPSVAPPRPSVAPPRPSVTPPPPSVTPPRPSAAPPRPSVAPPRPSVAPPRPSCVPRSMDGCGHLELVGSDPANCSAIPPHTALAVDRPTLRRYSVPTRCPESTSSPNAGVRMAG